ncbi:MAG: hypothetical protein Q8Q33_04095 [Chlamydiota bacterium]|nr:hypothetical protein [Chlamydiota bacterium]
MRPTLHALSSIGLGVWMGYQLQSLHAFYITALTGTLVDIDHLFDYLYYWYRKNRLKKAGSPRRRLISYKNFMRTFYDGRNEKIFVFFHAFEWSLLLYMLFIFYGAYPYLILSLFAGHALHMVSDALYNKLRVKGYFLLYRIFHRFQRKKIDSPCSYLKMTPLSKYLYRRQGSYS